MGQGDTPGDKVFPSQDWRSLSAWESRGCPPLLLLPWAQFPRPWGSTGLNLVTSTQCPPGSNQEHLSPPRLDVNNSPKLISSWPANGFSGSRSGSRL